ncbi:MULTISPECIES: hypothetical protein [Brevibacillus]|uniref:hypothetical protein n=1 Tax=Brevibacillus TaxID=55080 RepID=UPI000271376D|nr:hypothetical protein [Brevibacillus sp. BC25]EJL32107.1 hypothetical protein PMI05_00395 [Brevibacillus sp. BC25]
MPRQLLMAIAVSTFLALMLSLVPTNQWMQADIPTFQSARAIHLSEQNALDLFTRMSTHYNIKRIKWENPSIYVDFVVKPAEKVELNTVYQDFYRLTYDLRTYADNVGPVYYRLLEETDPPKESRLLIAIQSTTGNLAGHDKPLTDPSDIQSFVSSTFPIRIEPYFYERISP